MTDIIARWRDAINDPPKIGRRVFAVTHDGRLVTDQPFDIGDGIVRWNHPVSEYLDITDEPAVPRAAVQAAAKYTRDCQEMARGNDEYVAFGTAMDIIEEYIGVTPTEVQLEPCGQCGGTGRISYSPNLNPNAFPAVTTAKCGRCGGTGVTPSEVTP